jgi:hypothetical protein
MSNKPNLHIQEFDKFLESTNATISPKLMRSDRNYQILRKAAFKLYNTPEKPDVLVAAEIYGRVFLEVKDKLEFVEQKSKPKTDYGLDAGGRPYKPFNRSSYQSADDKKAQAEKEAEEAFNVAKTMRDNVREKQERAQREAEENVVVRFESGPFYNRVNHRATAELQAKNKAKWKNIDRQRGITNV